GLRVTARVAEWLAMDPAAFCAWLGGAPLPAGRRRELRERLIACGTVEGHVSPPPGARLLAAGCTGGAAAAASRGCDGGRVDFGRRRG
ncbi:MAG TPA: hypothetical protein VFX28_14995, partial [Methylomirabilota bacterium]|nr:hypothetical protein [Methylomirabilota bacterium]